MERTTAGSDSERRRGSGRRHEPDGGSSGATGGGAVAALHGAAGNQAVGAAASDVQRQATASGPGTEATTASRDSADGLCSRCEQRYRAGKPLDCPDCEAALQRSVDPGGAGDGVVQPKLEVSQPDDPAEREAERVADAVMRADRSTAEVQSDSSGVGTRSGSRDVRVDGRPTGLRRLCSSCRDRKVRGQPLNCEACERKLQRSTTQRVPGASADVEEVVAGARGGGRPLDEGARSFFEARFGRDFGDVRVHTGERADRAAASLRARAFTVGRDVFMRSGEYRPDSRSGRRLLAHELTHVVQQTGGSGAAGDSVARRSDERVMRTLSVENPSQAVPGAFPGGVYQTNRETVQNHLDRLCPGYAAVEGSGDVTIDEDLCLELDFAAASLIPRPEVAGTQTPAGCGCVCDVVHSSNDWEIQTHLGGPTTGFYSTAGAYGTEPGGTGGIIKIPSPNAETVYGAVTESGERLPAEPWLLFAHELCGHAWLADRGREPNRNPPRWGRGGGGHEATVERENQIRREHGIPERGDYRDPYCGESYSVENGSYDWSHIGKCMNWRQEYNRRHGTNYDITDDMPESP